MDSMERFVADGHQRAREASEPRIRADVAKEFAARLQRASPEELPTLRREMEREIERRLERIALY
jgi:hypothetical protein